MNLTTKYKISHVAWSFQGYFHMASAVTIVLGLVLGIGGFLLDSGQAQFIGAMLLGLAFPIWNLPKHLDRLLRINIKVLGKSSPHHRQGFDIPIIGRSVELAKINQSPTDAVIVGQPGAGKTRLMLELARSDDTFFLIGGDYEQLRECIVSSEVRCILVDEAHQKLNLCDELNRLRVEEGLDFKIIASCWPSFRESISVHLDINSNRVVELSRLSRDQVLQLVQSVIPTAHEDVYREVIDQAAGLPGVAAFLSLALKEGNYQGVVTGEIAVRAIVSRLGEVLDPSSRAILGVLSVGGDGGMKIDRIANLLQLPPIKIAEIAAKLDAGGVIEDVSEDVLRVRTGAIRSQLIDETFFKHLPPIGVEVAIEASEDVEEARRALIFARSRGVEVPLLLLQQQISQSDDAETWGAYAWLGRGQVEWVTESEEFRSNGFLPGMFHSLDVVLPYIFNQISEEETTDFSDSAAEVLQNFVHSRNENALEVRSIVVSEVMRWFEESSDSETAMKVLSISLSPSFEDNSTDPGSGNRFTWSRGHISENQIAGLAELLDNLINVVQSREFSSYRALLEVVSEWAYPDRLVPNQNIDTEIAELMTTSASNLIDQFDEIARTHNGLAQKLGRIAERIGKVYQIRPHAEFQTLFPEETRRSLDNHQETADGWENDVVTLSGEYSKLTAQECCNRIAEFEKQASDCGMGYPRLTPRLCRHISTLNPANSSDYLDELIQLEAAPDLILPFLEAAISNDPEESEKVVSLLLADQRTVAATALAVLTNEASSENMIDLVDESIEDMPIQMISSIGWSKNLTRSASLMLLKHESTSISAAAAEAIWMSSGGKGWDEGLNAAWEEAVLSMNLDHHHFAKIFSKNPHLILPWLENSIVENRVFYFGRRSGTQLDQLFQGLTDDERLQVLRRFTDAGNQFGNACTKILVAQNVVLYERLLECPELEHLWTAPFASLPDEHWIEMADRAITKGVRPRAIADKAVFHNMSWSGDASAFWESRIRGFDILLTHPNIVLRRVADIAQEIMTSFRNKEIDSERNEEIYGR